MSINPILALIAGIAIGFGAHMYRTWGDADMSRKDGVYWGYSDAYNFTCGVSGFQGTGKDPEYWRKEIDTYYARFDKAAADYYDHATALSDLKVPFPEMNSPELKAMAFASSACTYLKEKKELWAGLASPFTRQLQEWIEHK